MVGQPLNPDCPSCLCYLIAVFVIRLLTFARLLHLAFPKRGWLRQSRTGGGIGLRAKFIRSPPSPASFETRYALSGRGSPASVESLQFAQNRAGLPRLHRVARFHRA